MTGLLPTLKSSQPMSAAGADKSISLATKIIPTAQRPCFTPSYEAGLTDKTSISSLANQSPILIKGSMAPLLASAPFHSTASGRIFWSLNLHICEWPLFGRMSSLNYKWKFALQGRQRLGKRVFKSRLGNWEPPKDSVGRWPGIILHFKSLEVQLYEPIFPGEPQEVQPPASLEIQAGVHVFHCFISKITIETPRNKVKGKLLSTSNRKIEKTM